MGISLYKLGKRHRQVSDQLQIKVTSPDPFELLEIYAIKLQKKLGNKETKAEILRNAARIIRIAKVDWLNQGRRPSPIAGAALKFGSELVKGVFLDFQMIAEVTGSGALSIRERYKEIQQIFYKVLQTLPWGKNTNIKDLSHHIPFLLGYIETLNNIGHEKIDLNEEEIKLNTIIKIEPPSFVKSQKGKERRKEKIQKAKERIQKVFKDYQDSSIEGLDQEDLEIEKLLLSGAKEEDLLEGNYFIQKQNKTFDVNSEELTENDIPDNQITDFIKSKEEIIFYEQHNELNDEEPPQKKKKQ